MPEVNWDYAKRLIPPIPHDVPHPDKGWLDLGKAATVEVTSEEKEYPIESALVFGETRGWRADSPVTQTIRLIFDQPHKLAHIALVFEETEMERTQEFVLRWSGDGGLSFREVVRNSGILVFPTRSARSRNTQLNSPMSPYLN